jgi:hypothetical protein
MRALLKLGQLLVGIGSISMAGCGMFETPPPPAPYKAIVTVTGDPGRPLFGATITSGKSQPILTGVDGKANLVFNGADGDVREVQVTCPPGHQQASGAISIRLTRLVGDQVPTYAVSCPPLRRKVVVAVRAENGPFLPVKYLNQVVATTDAGGAAHFALEIEPGTFSVQLDTTERKDLKPPSPGRILSVGQQDDVLVLDQKFEVIRKYVPPPPPPSVPKDLNRLKKST